MKKEILNFCETFFEKLCMNIDSLEIKKKTDTSFMILLSSSDWEEMIGEQWQTIESLQKIIEICVNNKCEKKIKVRLKINDYFKTRDQRLFEFIDSKIDILLRNGWEYELPDYSPHERKKIHFYISRLKNWIKTKSRWKDKDRRIYLLSTITEKPIRSKLTIDIDWDNI